MSTTQEQIAAIERKIKKLRDQPRTQYVDRCITRLIEQKTQLRLRGRVRMRR